jgi:acyl-CoA synthetase (AMP-forming)/AMP-acid ligase II
VSEILARFADLCRDDPTRLLIHVPGADHALSASDIFDAHLRYADRLGQIAGLQAGELIVSAAGNHPASVGFFLACRAIGVAIMPVDPGTPIAEILGLAERFGAAALLLPAAMAAGKAQFGEDTSVEFGGLRLVPSAYLPARAYPGVAILKLTSGSTGLPKAALANDAQMIGDGTQIARAMGIRPCDTQIAVIPLSHSYGLGVLLMPLLLQATAIVLRDSFVPPQLAADAHQFAARILPGVPFMFQYFVTNPPPGGWPRGLRWLISAGAPLAPSTVRAFHDRFDVKIHSFYGTTETGGIAFDDDDEVRDEPVVGHALPGVTITLQPDEHAPDGAGRIHVRSAAVAGGYTDDTRDAFEDQGFLTGDYGGWDAGQRLTLRGRVSAFVNVAGRKVQPEEVEQVLRTMPGVADVRILAAPDARRGQQIVACIVADAGDNRISTLSVRQFCAARLAAHKIPRTILFLSAMPLTVRGKTDRAALEDLVRARLRGEGSAL